MESSDLLAGLMEATWLFAPAFLCLTLLSVWLGWPPVPARGLRGRRLLAALATATAGVVGLYTLAAASQLDNITTGELLVLLMPATFVYAVGAVAVTIAYLRRERITILRLVVTWALATIGAAILFVVIIGAIALVGGATAT